jgi:hypothetical protein
LIAHENRDDFAVVEDRGWPLLTVRFPAAVSADGMQAFVDAVDRAYDRAERFFAVINASSITRLPSPAARKILTDWLTNPRRVERDRAFTIGSAVNMVRRPVSPVHLTATLQEAAQFAKRRLVEEGVALNADGNALYAELTAPRAARAR